MSRFFPSFKHSLWLTVLVVFLSSGILSACSAFPLFSETKTNYPQAEVVFQVVLPAPVPQDAKLMLEIVDDVTGLAFNPTRYEMTQQDDKTYFVKLPLVIGSVIKYRYVRQASVSTVEFTPQGNQVRFRLAEVTGPAIFRDTVSAWIDQKYTGAVGRVTGQLLNAADNSPIPNLLVGIDGAQSVTSSDGTFVLEGIAPGTHNFVAFSMDGQYATFQQGVVVSDGANTPVAATLTKRQTVNVTFNVSFPSEFSSDYPLRIATNMQSLGNAYSDLGSGSTTVAANLPVLTRNSSSNYSITLALPVGFDFRYKFTLGDGLWNSELNSQGAFVLRQLIVPAKSQTVNSKIATFITPGFAPVTFDVFTRAVPPAGESVSVQLNPFGWFVPLPMLKVSDYEWKYTLYSPMNILGPVEYRFCRDNACELTSAVAANAQAFTPSADEQKFTIQIDQWMNLQNYQVSPDQLVTDGNGLQPRLDFLAGFELDSSYSPEETAFTNNGLSKIINEGSNFVVLTPTWSATRNNPPILESLPNKDVDWSELVNMASALHKQGVQVAIFPQLNFLPDEKSFWQLNSKQGWWQSWFDRYQRYMIQAADWASTTNAEALIIGDPTIRFSENSSEKWQSLVDTVRSHYKGKVIGILSAPTQEKTTPTWLSSVDEIYVLYSPALSQVSSTTTQELIELFSADLQKNLQPNLSKYNKPVLIGINYPSAENAFAGCKEDNGSCLNNWADGALDLNVQLRIYNAAFIAVAKENWIQGFISRNFFPEAVVMDNSSSVNGKPAMDILWFWYHFILNKTS